MIRAALLLSSVLLCVACAAASELRAGPAGGAALVVASDLDNAPFAHVDAEGRPAGRDVRMMERVGAVLGREVRWRRMPFEDLLAACAAGEVDVVCATLGVTQERARSVRFTRPYFETSLAVVVRTGEGEPASLADLAGRRVAAGAGTTSEAAVRRVLRYSHGVFGAKSVEALRAGEVAAAAMDRPAARAVVAASRGELALLDEPLAPESYALAVRPAPPGEEDVLVRDLDRALAVLAASGTLAELDRAAGLR